MHCDPYMHAMPSGSIDIVSARTRGSSDSSTCTPFVGDTRPPIGIGITVLDTDAFIFNLWYFPMYSDHFCAE